MMSALGEKQGGLPRPYTQGTFQNRLNDFEELIKELTLQDVEATPEERRQMITENLRYDQFCDSIRALFGGDVRNQDLKAIYRKISTNPDAKVDWSELFGYFQSDTDEQEITVGEEVSVFTVSARRRVGDAAGDRKRRDIIVIVRHIRSMESYLTVSQKGAISLWSTKLRLQACTDISEASWITGCDWLPSLRRIGVCTERSLCVWDPRAKGKNQQIFAIKPIENSPQCMAWVPYSTNNLEDTILFGDDQGYVNMLTIAAKDLNTKHAKTDKKNAQTYNLEPQQLSYPLKKRKLHDDWVLKIKYFPELRCFASCSPSNTRSFVLEEVDRISDDIPIRDVDVPKGVNAFDYCARANIIATGGVDKVIRVWHPHIFSRPTGKLIGHLFTIVDIVCNEKDQHIISLSTARVFRIWDIHTLTSLQIFTDNEERPGEKRIYSMLFDNKNDRLLTGSSVLDAWPLTRAVQDTMQVPHTHDRPISQLVYNPELHQVITVCTESVLRVWEAETGKLVYFITDPHGSNIEVTALALDKSGYRLASGALDGSVKVWDFGSGQEIKVRAGKGTDEDLSIIALQYCIVEEERCIIAIGWNNRIRILQDLNETNDLPVLRDFSDVRYLTQDPGQMSRSPSLHQSPLPDIGTTPRSSQANITNIFKKEYVLHTHEVTSYTTLLPDLLITGCLDGSLIMWNIAKSRVETVIPLPDPLPRTPDSEPRSRENSMVESPNRGVTQMKFLFHKSRKLDPRFIKKRRRNSDDSDEDDDKELNPPPEEEPQRKISRASKHSRNTSRNSINRQQNDIEIDQALMDELTAKVEGVPIESLHQKEGEQAGDTARESGPDAPAAESRMEQDTKQSDKHSISEHSSGYSDSASRDTDDPESKMIVETFPPILVTCHVDSFIKFWTPQGVLLREISAMTRRQGSAATAVCHDEDVNLLITGDHRGYITMWNVSKFLENPDSQDKDLIKQLLCWRAHLTKIVHLEYIDSIKAIVSASTDGSVRVWWGKKGRFVGFFGQHRSFNFPSSEETAGLPVMPYDINEGPLAPIKSVSERQKIRAQQKFEYPLIFDSQRWEPFRRSAYHRQQERTKPPEPTDKKFFAALIKPKPSNDSLESYRAAEMRTGAVFRALPVYRVRTPSKPKSPELSLPSAEEQNNSFLFSTFNAVSKGAKAFAALGKKNGDNCFEKKAARRKSKAGVAFAASSRSTSASEQLVPASPRKR